MVGKWLKKEVTFGMLAKLMVCLNIVVLAYCWLICNIRTTQDEETLKYINSLENRIEVQRELIDLYKEVYNGDKD